MVAWDFRFHSEPYDLLGMGGSNYVEVLSPTVLVNGLYRKAVREPQTEKKTVKVKA